jgi:hypothetical protein
VASRPEIHCRSNVLFGTFAHRSATFGFFVSVMALCKCKKKRPVERVREANDHRLHAEARRNIYQCDCCENCHDAMQERMFASSFRSRKAAGLRCAHFGHLTKLLSLSESDFPQKGCWPVWMDSVH